MPSHGSNRRAAQGPHSGKRTRGGSDFLRFLRYSHIFAAAIREILDVKLLREVSRCPLTPGQFQVLKLMSLDGRHQAGEVADYLGVTPPAATKNIDKLQRLGLVSRTRCKGDRRVTLLSVSPKGRRLVQRYDQLRAARLTPVVEGFAAAEIEQFNQLLTRFSVSLLSQEPSSGGLCLRCAGYIEDDCPVGRVCGGCPYEKVRAAHPREGVVKGVS